MAVAELIVKLIGDVSEFKKTMGQVGTSVSKFGKNLTAAGSTLTKAITLPLAGIAVASLKMAADFQGSMSKVSALGEITGANLKKLESQALELGASTQFSAQEAAEGMAELASSGMKTEEIYAAMPGTLDLAAAAQISVGEAAGITAVTLGQFQLQAGEAGRVADVMARSAAEGQLTITDLAEAMKYVGPVANSVGRSLEETTAAITLLSNAGIKGSQAGTALRMGMIRFIKPTKQAQEVINELGLSLKDGEGKIRPLADIIGQLSDKNAHLGQVTKLVGVEAATAWQALVDKGAPALQEMNDKLINSNGAAASMAATLRDNLKGSFEQMWGAVETLAISIGLALEPAARALMGVIQQMAEKGVELVQWFRSLSQPMQNAIIAFTTIVGVIGPIAFTLGKIITAIGGFIKGLAAAKGAVAVFVSATGIGAIAIAVGLAVAAIIYFYDEIDRALWAAADIVREAVTKIGEFFGSIIDYVVPVLDSVVGFFSEWGGKIYDVVYAALDVVLAIFGTSFDEIATYINETIDAAIFIFDNFGLAVQVVLDSILSIFGTSVAGILEFWVETWKAAVVVWENFGTIFTGLLDDFLSIFGTTSNEIVGYWNQAMNLIKDIFATAFDVVLTGLGYAEEVIGTFSDSGAAAIGRLRTSIENLKKPAEAAVIEIKKTDQAVTGLAKAADTSEKKVSENVKAIDKGIKPIKELKVETDKLTGSTDKATGSTKKKTEAEREAEKQAKALQKAEEDHAKALDDLVRESDKYKDLLVKIKDGSIPAEDAGRELEKMYKDADTALENYNAANHIYMQYLEDYAGAGNVPAEKLVELITQLEIAKGKLDEFKGKLDETTGKDTDFLGGILGGQKVDFNKVATDLASDFSKALSDALGNALSAVLSGGSARQGIADSAKGLGSSMGAIAGAAFGGPFGAAIGGAVGGALGEYVGEGIKNFGKDSEGTRKAIRTVLDITFFGMGTVLDAAFGDAIFGSESEGTKTRKAIDKWFAEQFEAKKIMLVINGQLQQLKDFDFGGGEWTSESSPAHQYFKSLEGTAQTAFTGIGGMFAALLGVSAEYSQGIGEVIALNVGGSLNNVQIMLDALGLGFEESKKIIMEAMLQGELSFMQAQTALNALVRVTEKGIPDGVGYTVQAFENLKNAGIKGGRYATDALRDLGYEAREVGAKDLPALMANLLKSGKFTQEEIDKVFSALRDHGINSIDALTNATDEQLLGVLSQLEAQKFPFADAVDDAKDLTNAINNMPKSKDITFNLKTNLDANTKAAMDAGFVPGTSNTITSTPKPSAKGNVFSAGAIKPFAKGGIVSDFTMFNIGSMAERGPEAILPLERLPNGKLGVLSAASNGNNGGGNVSITINAPYAQPGVAETIRREVEKIMDKKNRMPGVRR